MVRHLAFLAAVLLMCLLGAARTTAAAAETRVALVLGNEEQGPPPPTLEACEARLTLPGSGLVESLNVAAAAAVLFHALGAVPRRAA